MQPHPLLTQHYRTPEEKPQFVEKLFDDGARYYDRTSGWGFFGSGKLYRKSAQVRAGLKPGMRVLDVATGTGLVAEAAVSVLGSGRDITCVDPSRGMLAGVAAKAPGATVIVGKAENLPLPDAQFDFLTMGYALRHVSSLDLTFSEYHRVLKPGGKLLILEVTKPARGLRAWLFRIYFKNIYPTLTRIFTRSREAEAMMLYFWETMDAVVPPEKIIASLQNAGFTKVNRHVLGGLFSEYTAEKP